MLKLESEQSVQYLHEYKIMELIIKYKHLSMTVFCKFLSENKYIDNSVSFIFPGCQKLINLTDIFFLSTISCESLFNSKYNGVINKNEK